MHRREMWGLVASVVLLWAGCGGEVSPPPPPGTGRLSLTFSPTPPSATGLTLSKASVRVEQMAVLGDVAPSDHTTLSETELDMLGSARELWFDKVPQGLYSLIKFEVTRIELQGEYREGSSDPKQLEGQINLSAWANLRCPAGVEVAPDQVGLFGILIDGGHWFAGVPLDQAQESDGQIKIDDQNNVAIGQAIAANVVVSFALGPPPAHVGPH